MTIGENVMGATDKETGEYITPYQATKNRIYNCLSCYEEVVFCHGPIVRPYFRHTNNSSCTIYTDRPSESDIHKNAKKRIVYEMNKNRQIKIQYKSCGRCMQTSDFIYKLKDNSIALEEVKFFFNEATCYADVACKTNDNIDIIIEICNTHKTAEGSRPEPWFELSAYMVSQSNSDSVYRCSRVRSLCKSCENQIKREDILRQKRILAHEKHMRMLEFEKSMYKARQESERIARQEKFESDRIARQEKIEKERRQKALESDKQAFLVSEKLKREYTELLATKAKLKQAEIQAIEREERKALEVQYLKDRQIQLENETRAKKAEAEKQALLEKQKVELEKFINKDDEELSNKLEFPRIFSMEKIMHRYKLKEQYENHRTQLFKKGLLEKAVEDLKIYRDNILEQNNKYMQGNEENEKAKKLYNNYAIEIDTRNTTEKNERKSAIDTLLKKQQAQVLNFKRESEQIIHTLEIEQACDFAYDSHTAESRELERQKVLNYDGDWCDHDDEKTDGICYGCRKYFQRIGIEGYQEEYLNRKQYNANYLMRGSI